MNLRTEKFTFNHPTYPEMSLKIREQVFVMEQKVDKKLEFDGLDPEAHHYLVFDGVKAVATARWRETTAGIKLERFAVLGDYRNKGVGKVILDEVLKDVLLLEKEIYLHAQIAAVLFYERSRFRKTGGIFMEAGIEHYRMVYLGS